MIKLNPSSLEEMQELMDKYGNSDSSYFGENESGEMVEISIFHDKIIVSTYQENDFIRKNIYHYYGESEEFYEH